MKVTLKKDYVKASGTLLQAGSVLKVTREFAIMLGEQGYLVGSEEPKAEEPTEEKPEENKEPATPAPTKRKRQPRNK